MAEHLLVASLACELVGVSALAKSLALGSADEYVTGDEREYGRSLLHRDLSRARDMTEAGVGLGLIFVGVAGQICHAIDADLLHISWWWWYVALGGVIGLAAVLYWRLANWRQRAVIAARLRARPRNWAVTVDDYELGQREQGQVRGDVLAAGLGRDWWESLQQELRQAAAEESGTASAVHSAPARRRKTRRRAFLDFVRRKLLPFLPLFLLAGVLAGLLGVKVSPWWIPVPFGLYAVMFLVALPSVETSQRALDFFRLVVVVAAFSITAIVVGSDFRGNKDFFAVSAQVIPVLALALAVEARTLGAFYDRGDFLLAFVVVAALAAGEIESLNALASRHPARYHGWASASAIAAGFAGVLVAGLAGVRRQRKLPSPRSAEQPPRQHQK